MKIVHQHKINNICLFHSIISTLETLKKEAADVTRKVEETDVIMAEVETTSQQYSALAQSCSSIYFTLEALNLVGVSLKLFLYLIYDILDLIH